MFAEGMEWRQPNCPMEPNEEEGNLSTLAQMTVEEFVSKMPSSLTAIQRNLQKQFSGWTLAQLTPEDWQSVCHARGIGQKKYAQFIAFLEELSGEELTEKYIKKQERGTAPDNQGLSSIKREYPCLDQQPVKEFLKQIPHNERKIHEKFSAIKDCLFGEVTDEEWTEAIQGKGMGAKKKALVQEQFQSFVQRMEHNQSQWIMNTQTLFEKDSLGRYLGLSREEMQEKAILREVLMQDQVIDQVPLNFGECLAVLGLMPNPIFQVEVDRLKSASLRSLLTDSSVMDSEDSSVLQMMAVISHHYAGIFNRDLPDSMIENWQQLKENEQFVLKSRVLNMTLEETGDALGVTRERTRQIETRAKNQLRQWCETEGYKKMVDTLLQKQSYLPYVRPLEKLLCYLYEDYAVKDGQLMLATTMESLLLFQATMTQQLGQSLYLTKEVFDEELQQYPSLIPFLAEDNWPLLCRWLGIGQYEDKIYLTGGSKHYNCALIVMLFFKDRLILSQHQQLLSFIQHYNAFFPQDILEVTEENEDKVVRQISSNLNRSILRKVDTGIYQYQDTTLPEEFIEEVRQYIDDTLGTMPVVYDSKLRHVFADQLAAYHANPSTLYQALKAAFADVRYTFSSGRTWRLFPLHQELTTAEIFTTVLDQHGGAVEREWLREALGIQDYTIDQMVSSPDNDLRLIGSKVVRQTLPLDEPLIRAMQAKMEHELQDYHGIAPYRIYAELAQEMADMLMQHQITKENIKSFIVMMDPSLKGSRQFLSKDGTTLWQYCQLYLGDKTVYQIEELENLLSGMGYSNTTITMKLKQAWETDELYKLNKQQFIFANQLELNAIQRQQFIQWVHCYLTDKRWICLTEDLTPLADACHDLQATLALPYELTPELMRHLLATVCHYHYLTIVKLQPSNDMLMVTPEDVTLQQLLQEALDQYSGPWQEKPMVDYFIAQRLMPENKTHILLEYVKDALGLVVDPETKVVSIR